MGNLLCLLESLEGGYSKECRMFIDGVMGWLDVDCIYT